MSFRDSSFIWQLLLIKLSFGKCVKHKSKARMFFQRNVAELEHCFMKTLRFGFHPRVGSTANPGRSSKTSTLGSCQNNCFL